MKVELHKYPIKGKNQTNSRVDITLALDSGVLDEIRNDAHVQASSVNAKINSILTKYVMFYKHAETRSCLFVPAIMHSKIIDMIDEHKLVEILKKRNLDEIPTLLAHDNIAPTVENFNEKFFSKLFLMAGLYSRFRYNTDEKGYRFLLFEHKYNIKWSRIIGEVFSYLIEIILNIHNTVHVSPNVILIRLEK